LNLPAVDMIELDKIAWYIITEQNGKDVFAALEKKKYDPVLFGLTDKDYEALSVNISKIMKLVQQQKSIIAAYKKYYEDQYQSIEDTNQKNEKMLEQAKEQNKKAEKAGLFNKFKKILGD
jgi:glutamate racemase